MTIGTDGTEMQKISNFSLFDHEIQSFNVKSIIIVFRNKVPSLRLLLARGPGYSYDMSIAGIFEFFVRHIGSAGRRLLRYRT